jgi:CHAT domain-containing protein
VLCSSPDTSPETIRRISSQLGEYVLAPIESELEAGTPLWIEFDEPLSSIPFGLLPLKSGRLVVDRFPWAAVPALSLVESAAGLDSGRIGDGRMLAVGISFLSSGEVNMPPLPAAVVEAEEVARRYPNSQLLLNDMATGEKIEREMATASVFHFAGHSVNDASQTSLVVAADGESASGFAKLGADQISRMDLKNCRLAVLSACSVERPELLEERAAFGLATALLTAGVRGVLAPRWDLDSAVAVRYSREFYENLDRGDTAIMAANEAALAVRANPNTSHPYYWADYQFFGGD